MQFGEQSRDDHNRGLVVSHVVQGAVGIEAFQQHRARAAVVLQQPHRSAPVPELQGQRLAARLLIDRLQLQRGRGLVDPYDR